MESRSIKFFHASDWVWVFADDRLVHSGHSCSAEELLRALDYEDFSSHGHDPSLPDEDYWLDSEYSSLADFPQDLFPD